MKWLPLTLALVCLVPAAGTREIRWQHLSSKHGQLSDPGGSKQQTGLLVARLDKSAADSFVISFRVQAPALVWYRRTPTGWERSVIEKDFLTLEAGGAAYDIDGDGDLDVVFGEDWQGSRLYWWENPYPNFDATVSWKRHVIKSGGGKQHHDQIFADFKGTGKPQLVFWNQGVKTLFLADIPSDPRTTADWPLTMVYSGKAGEQVEGAAQYAEGLDAFDVDGDGRLDLIAGNSWFRYEGEGSFKAVRVGTIGGRIRAGKFRKGKHPQIVISPGDGSGPLRIYECRGDPADSASWVGHDLLDRDMVHGHTLDVGDVSGDGHLDIFAAEMAKWSNKLEAADNPTATAWILLGDGKGGFRNAVLVTGEGWHEGKLGDLDGDGDLDILNKPYTWDAPRIDVWLNNGTKAGK